MQTKIKIRVGVTVGVLTATTLVLWICFIPAATSWMVRRNAKHFREMYQPDKMYACIHEDEFAIRFAGTRGLPEIEKLSRDESLIPSARSTASNLYAYISSGQHLPSFRHTLANNPYWVGRLLLKSLLRNDTAYLKKRALLIQTDELKQSETDGGEERR